MRHTIPAFLCLCMLLMAGCQTASDRTGNQAYSPFFTPAEHLADLIQTGKFIKASHLFNNQQSVITAQPHEPEVQAAMNALAAGLRPVVVTPAEEARTQLAGTVWPVPAHGWPAIKAIAENARTALLQLQTHTILSLPQYDSGTAMALQKQSSGLSQQITVYTAEVFAAYPLDAAASFFDVYPVDIDAPLFLQQIKPDLLQRLKSAPAPALATSHATYGSFLPSDVPNKPASLHYNSLLPKPASKASFKEKLQAFM
ncbi:hypothetical protein [Oleidesulfovibrio sp.]|uniref:hypothetical protein n=1 Tax=Oleidesulfovibrio sp. TaxID=2909707 RepID=UPI003A8A2C7F